ncbi:MFS transporter [Curtobacterium sp. MCPF17_002]|uniref:MFS transporter n=1 Tax=Curtobacterium sp. MCPF17_002 TaxID=2175645 RepID=UPI000DAAB1FA|nr:MFS transporter [Curtobacterium sp. MCPF17_002]WIB79018.1 MFS transporter [Curtobacterium sp. MCPF17_002]
MSTPTTAPPRVPVRSALTVPAFRRLWVAGIVSDAGDWLMFIALPLVVLQLSGSALGTSLAFLLELIPPVVLSPLIARVVDRLPRKHVMAVAMAAQAVALLPLLAVRDGSDVHLVYAVIVAHATCAAFFEPAKNSLLPTLVAPEQVTSANALVGLNNDLGRLIGGPIGGVLLAVSGIGVVALVDIGTYVVAVALVLTLPAPPKRQHTRRNRRDTRHATRRGIASALADPAIRGPVVVVLAAAVAQGLFVVLFVFFVTDVVRGSSTDVGLLRGVQAIGAILAGTVLGVLGARLDVLRLTLVGAVTFTVLTAVTWNLAFVTHAVPVYAVLFAAMGAPAVLMGAGLTSLLQRAARDDTRGSAFAALGLAQAVGQAIGLVAAGLLQDHVGTLPLLEVQAGAYALAAVLAVVILPRWSRPALPR